MESNYMKFRGKCKELSEQLILEHPDYKLVRGHYDCPIWGQQPHWWCVAPDGMIHDPSAKQFPSGGLGEYIPFNGKVTCAECSKEITEEEARFESNYAFCSDKCLMRFVGL